MTSSRSQGSRRSRPEPQFYDPGSRFLTKPIRRVRNRQRKHVEIVYLILDRKNKVERLQVFIMAHAYSKTRIVKLSTDIVL